MWIRTAVLTAVILGLVPTRPPAAARGGHHGGFGGHHGMRGGFSGGTHGDGLAGDQRHANNEYVKAASKEEDKLLDSKIKSICHGC
jgi:hypothetical protein